MDDLVAKAAQYAGLKSRPRLAASNIARVRRSCHAYMSKYLTKDPPPDQMDTSDGWEDLIPHQWWCASAGARALVNGHLFKLPTGFVAFLMNRQADLERAGLILAHPIQIAVRKTITGDLPIEVTRFRFRGTNALSSCLEYYALWVDDPRMRIDMAHPM